MPFTPVAVKDEAGAMDELVEREGEPDAATLEGWATGILHGATTDEILDTRGGAEKERLQTMKESMWGRFGYSERLLSSMMSPDFWEAEYEKIPALDAAIRELR